MIKKTTKTKKTPTTQRAIVIIRHHEKNGYWGTVRSDCDPLISDYFCYDTAFFETVDKVKKEVEAFCRFKKLTISKYVEEEQQGMAKDRRQIKNPKTTVRYATKIGVNNYVCFGRNKSDVKKFDGQPVVKVLIQQSSRGKYGGLWDAQKKAFMDIRLWSDLSKTIGCDKGQVLRVCVKELEEIVL